MQHHFVGDVGDFGKYGLLRALTGVWPSSEPRLTLGVVWYLPAGSIGSVADGQKLVYLNQPDRFRSCDPRLYDALSRLLEGGDRSLGAVESNGILGDGTIFFDDPVPRGSPSRETWLQDAVEAVRARDVVFLDPDKGLPPRSAGPSSTEHAYVHELKPFVQREQTVIVYHHLGRTDTHPVQMRDWAERLAHELRLDAEPHILWYRRGTARAYFVLPAEAHAGVVGDRLQRLENSLWFKRQHFTPLPPATESRLSRGESAPRTEAWREPHHEAASSVAEGARPTGGVAALLAGGESQTVEFKSTARWNVRAGKRDMQMEHVIVKTVCGFLNSEGGKLIIGVDDDGNVVGLDADLQTLGRKANRNGYELFLRQLLDDGLSSPTAGIVHVDFEAIDGMDVCVVSASRYRKPVFAKPPAGRGGPTEFYVRVGNSTKVLVGNDMLEYQTNHWNT
jgi:hypothetical protein